jgi:hypothetical protein
MKLNDMLSEQQLDELAPAIGAMARAAAPLARTAVSAVGQAVGSTIADKVNAPATSNDPKVQTMMVAQQAKQKQDQKKGIQAEITALTKQISDLRRQLSTIR